MNAAAVRGPEHPGAPERRTAEFDAFGPWVDPVRTPEDVPPLFRDHAVDLAGSRLVLKVPRDIARRDANPDMDLYDHLLVLGPDRFTVLTRVPAPGAGRHEGPREGRRYDVREIPYDRVAAVGTSVDLLDGRLTVHALTGAPVEVRYSGSSGDVITELVELLRELAWPVPSYGPPAPLVDLGPGTGRLERRALGEHDIGLVSAYREIADREPGLRVVAAHPRQTVAPGRGGLAQVGNVLRPMTLHAAILATNGRELQVFGRRAWLARGRTPVHSESRLVLPLDRLTGAQTRPHPGYPDVTVVTLRAGDASLDLPVPAGSDAERVLGRLLG
ncbi:hypothetical protein [Cellulomonas endometrii]|uniref:hypothetical protein n=1 Tax=Cellulomonas endometrii TaxID=3036301 RepID=UPI0024AE7772|nr:hypothetical protein [Cellulomonas endometrii]